MRSTFLMDVLKSAVGLYIGLVILFLLLRVLGKLPNGVGGFFQSASKLATPGS